ncbi:MAG: prolipoprotein diacylglyceryl transferase [bacterium]|nr:prolipoprotein diacylglyceryl transferase [bacterium]
MINFLHTFQPSPILAALGPINIYWYGLFIMLGLLAALTAAVYLAGLHGLKKEVVIDLAVWLTIGGLIGARAYDIGLEWRYFSAHPADILKIWQGGLAIHGAIIGGLIALWLFSKKYGHSLWQLAALAATALPLGQAIGRWGNYFNQELFGYPTGLPWGIPIDLARRPWQYLNYQYFHPTFLYESLGSLLIFTVMIFLHYKRAENYKLRVMSYLFMYSILRFSTEFIRIDETPSLFGLRFPQLISLAAIFLCLGYFAYFIWLKIKKIKLLDN